MSNIAPISMQIWDMKYRLKAADGAPLDATIEESWRRVARALAAPEADAAAWEPRFYEALTDFRFLPAGRILAGAGARRSVTLFNCFVMGAVPDDMTGIFEHLKEAALTMQQGGGIGYDFSTLRPKGAPVKGVGADASGPLSFMDVWDAMCRTIMSAGYRRGAMMATLRCDHPDIEAFIDAKRQPGRLRMFNLSVLVTDAFMAAVEDDRAWELVFDGVTHRSVAARELWDKIMRATYAHAEPGVIFIDRINRLNNLWYCEKINATNPCGEQPLPPYGACLLGSVNLARLVATPFEPSAALDLAALDGLARVAVRMLDNAIDVSNFPLEAQAHEARAKRRIGLGVTGLADALIMCGARYGSDASLALVDEWLHTLQRAAYLASTEIAAVKGAFPLYDADAYLGGEAIGALDGDLREAIRAHGIRNALLTSVAPTGTISLLADNVSSGLEPVFSHAYTRNVLMPDGGRSAEEVSAYAYRLFRRLRGETATLPDAFVDVESLTPMDHLRVQATVQARIDSSISKTINCAEGIAFEDFKDIYREAYRMGCKGCTTYRPQPGDRRGARGRRWRRPAPGRAAAEGAAGAPRRPLRGGRRGLYDPAPEPARGVARRDLQGTLARERPRHVHHHQRHREGRPPAPLRDVRQLEEHGALRLDHGADAHDQRRVPARRRRLLRGRRAQGGVRPARRPVGRGALRALDHRGHRRRHRAPHDRHRLHAGAGRRDPGRRILAQGGRRRNPPDAFPHLPQMLHARPDPPGRLRSMHVVRVQQVRVRIR